MSIGRPTSRGTSAAALKIVSVLLAVRLFVPAAALTFSRRSADEFASTGLPAWSRFALALPEMLGSILFLVPRTFYVGASVLLLDLVGAIVAHLYLGIRPIGLYVLWVAVLSVAIVRWFLPTCTRQR